MRLNEIWQSGSGQIYCWRRQFSEDGARAFPSNGKSRDEELAVFRNEVKELCEERDILRKATAIFSRPPENRVTWHGVELAYSHSCEPFASEECAYLAASS
jgi:transposase-like protein